MKRLVLAVLVTLLLVCLFPFAAFAEDYSGKSDAELMETYNAIRLELVSRGYRAEGKKVLIDSMSVQI